MNRRRVHPYRRRLCDIRCNMQDVFFDVLSAPQIRSGNTAQLVSLMRSQRPAQGRPASGHQLKLIAHALHKSKAATQIAYQTSLLHNAPIVYPLPLSRDTHQYIYDTVMLESTLQPGRCRCRPRSRRTHRHPGSKCRVLFERRQEVMPVI
ncbi:hypothetical protein BC628DRAFT_631258 [Trametes gibbosa]|nr:hypothetical protein BC628DRAFT_631258 [Trametes gibbosa]